MVTFPLPQYLMLEVEIIWVIWIYILMKIFLKIEIYTHQAHGDAHI
jgi:hypothetical protein